MKGILFNIEMVRAILDGRKTQTRRLMKERIKGDGRWGYTAFTPDGYISFRKTGYDGEWFFELPYQPGDVLYVRETFSIDKNGDYVYRTNYGSTEDDSFPPSMFKWKPSIHMPKEAARIFLKVTDVRAERLNDITEGNAKAEGFISTAQILKDDYRGLMAKDRFIKAWNEIYAQPKPVYRDGEIDHYTSYPWENVQETREYRGEEMDCHRRPLDLDY